MFKCQKIIERVIYPPSEANQLLNPLTATSLSFALQHFINSDQPFHGQKVHSQIIKTGFKPNLNIAIKLLVLHLKSSNVSYARRVFDELPERTLSAYNYMISGYTKHGFVYKAFELFRELTFSNEKADGFTFSMVLKASCCNILSSSRFYGKEIHSQVLKSGIEDDDVLDTALVDSYVKAGRFDYARKVFDLMLDNNVLCSTSIITGYMNQGLVEEAEDIFNRTVSKDAVVYNAMIEGYSKSIETAKKAVQIFMDMKRANLKPTISTFASIIGACSILSAFEIGQQVQGLLLKTDFFTDVKMGSALLDMYSKCGRTESARAIFDNMPDKNVFSWTSMIDGYGKNSDPFKALEIFHRMRLESIKPNYVTFLSALSACGHAGLVERGQEIFKSMTKDYLMKPRIEHYACMVDILGRAGCLHQALNFIKNMPEIPNSDVWAPLLSSSRLHGDVDMANLAAKELFDLKCHYRPGAYVALSNTLAEAGKWDNVTDLRASMKIKGVSKGTGFSWIGNKSGLEAFHAGQT